MTCMVRRVFAAWLVLTMAALLLVGCAAPLVDKATYVTTVFDQVQRASAGVAELSALAGSPQFDDPAWHEQVSAQLADLRALTEDARALTPPEALAGAHQTYLDALGQLEQVTTTVEDAVAASDPDRLREAVPLLAEVEQLLTAVQGLIGE